MNDERQRRAAANEAAFRSANERIEELNRAFAGLTESGTWLCECADPACVERLQVSLDEYAAVRAHDARFLVSPGHELHEVERIVDRREGYLVVEKRAGIGRDVVEAAAQEERRAAGEAESTAGEAESTAESARSQGGGD